MNYVSNQNENANIKLDFEAIQETSLSVVQQNTKMTLEETDIEQLRNRNLLYSNLLKLYIDNYRKRLPINRKQKNSFFVFFLSTLILIVLCSVGIVVVSIFQYYRTGIINVSTLTALIAILITMVSTFLIIPQIMAKYLFSIDEDRYLAEIIKSMLIQDDNTRRAIKNKRAK